ncbi:MAG: hypothetical protein QOC95_98 [Thermoleophilaceae bacterium]|nr:hypothetical protein [Thermoleophilaceae bacterium]
MTTHSLPRPLPGRTAALVVASALAGAVALIAVIGLVRLATGAHASSATHTFTAAGKAFAIGVPDGWTALRGTRLAAIPGRPAAAIRRADGRGLVLVRRTGAVSTDLRAVAGGLTSELKRRVPGFQLVSARMGRVRAGGAFLYTFARGTGGAAQSIALTKVRGVTYRIDSVVAGDSPDAARQAGAIVGSFGP